MRPVEGSYEGQVCLCRRGMYLCETPYTISTLLWEKSTAVYKLRKISPINLKYSNTWETFTFRRQEALGCQVAKATISIPPTDTSGKNFLKPWLKILYKPGKRNCHFNWGVTFHSTFLEMLSYNKTSQNKKVVLKTCCPTQISLLWSSALTWLWKAQEKGRPTLLCYPTSG